VKHLLTLLVPTCGPSLPLCGSSASSLFFLALMHRFKVVLLVLLYIHLSLSAKTQHNEESEVFVKKLLASLSLKEKIGQMTQLTCGVFLNNDFSINTPALIQAVQEYGVGSFLNSPFAGGALNGKPGWNATEWINFITQIQTINMKYSNASIPMLYGIDSIHGATYVYGATFFPHNTGVAATFNTDLAQAAGAINAKDTRTAGLPWLFGPVLGLGVQPLWPRIYETFGEDPYLTSQMGVAIIRGMQGSNISLPTSVAATAKHYFGYSDPKSGKDRTPAWIPKRFLLQYFVRPFAAAFDAGVSTIMVNSGEINGIPMHASYELLTTLLRDELGFEGVAVSDWQDIEKLNFYHHIASTLEEAVDIGITAGLDMSMVPQDYTFPTILYSLVSSGQINESRIDESVARILKLKVDLGLFQNPFPDPNNPNIATIGSQADREVALNTARESITLLSNKNVNNKPLLPLSTGLTKVLVTGPAGNSLVNQNGGWSLHWGGGQDDSQFPFGSTIYSGISTIVGADHVSYLPGASFTDVIDLDAVVAAAQSSQVAIVAVGEAPESETLGDTNDLALSPSQMTLIQAIAATGTPTVVVLVEPRPRILTTALTNVSALLMAYLPGSEGGQAIAEILFGVVNPSGKLPITYPQFSGDIGVTYYHKYSEIEATSPLFEFGYGLSYTAFTYGPIQLSSSTVNIGQNLTLSVTVTNSGSVAGKEAVLLYVSDVYASITPEVKLLKRFQKSNLLAPGTSQTFTFSLTTLDLSFYGIKDTLVAEPGLFIVQIGTQTANFTLV
jgi:beta-glucosidase